MRQGLKEGLTAQSMVIGMTADLRDTTGEEQVADRNQGLMPGEGRRIIRQIGR